MPCIDRGLTVTENAAVQSGSRCAVPLDLDVLKERYQKELRWQMGNPQREDLTARLWIEVIEEERGRGR